MSCAAPETENSFADRLRVLIGHESVSAFSRRVGLSEAMIRKYLNGSEPTLSRANQIARQAKELNLGIQMLGTEGIDSTMEFLKVSGATADGPNHPLRAVRGVGGGGGYRVPP